MIYDLSEDIRPAYSKHGFTLIELVMVIAIIGILAAVTIPRLVDLGQSSRISATRAGLGALRSAIARRFAQSTGGGQPEHFPSSATGDPLSGADFLDGPFTGQFPLNALNGFRGIQVSNTPASGLSVSTWAGWWYVDNPASADYGRVGAYSDGVIDTSGF